MPNRVNGWEEICTHAFSHASHSQTRVISVMVNCLWKYFIVFQAYYVAYVFTFIIWFIVLLCTLNYHEFQVVVVQDVLQGWKGTRCLPV